MNNITEKYNGKNGFEGSIVSFKITDYHINLNAKNILVKYQMIVENNLESNVITTVNKSYNLYDEPAKFENGELLVDEFGNTYYEQIEVTPANLRFTDYQNYPLEYGVSEGLTTLEDVFFENTRSHILLINEYTEEDLLIKE